MRFGKQSIFIKPAHFQKPLGKSAKRDTNLVEPMESHMASARKFAAPLKTIGGENYMDVLLGEPRRPGESSCSKGPARVTTDGPKEDELFWLARCVIGDVKTGEVLPDLPFHLKENGFLTTTAKYFGGFRYLLECESTQALNKMLKEGSEVLSSWFQWIKPWHRDVESITPGRLCWLSIRGVPLHLWNELDFRKIANIWGEIVR